MRKWLMIGGAVIVVLAGVAAVVVPRYVEGRAVAEVDTVIAALGAGGVAVTRGPVTFDLWSRTLTVPDVAVTSGADTAKLGRFVARGVDLLAKDFTVREIEVGALDATARGVRLASPRLIATGVVVATAATAPTAGTAPEPGSGGIAAGTSFHTFEASDVTVSTVAATSPSPPQVDKTAASDTPPSAGTSSAPDTGQAVPIDVTVARLSGAGLARGRLETLTFDGVQARGATAPIDIGSVGFAGLDVAGGLAMAGRIAATPGAAIRPEQVAAVVTLLSGFTMKKIDMPNPLTGTTLSWEVMDVAWGALVGGVPTDVRVKLVGDVPLDETLSHHQPLLARGMKKVTMDVEMGATWNESTRTVTVRPGTFALRDLGTVSAVVTLGNVPREVFRLDAAGLDVAMMAFEVADLSLDVVDAGYQAIGGEAERAETIGKLGELRRMLTASGVPATNMIALAQASEQFMTTPGRTMTVKMKPKATPVTIGRLANAIAAPEQTAAVLEQMTVDVAVR